MENLNYPLNLQFKIAALAPQIWVKDNNENVIGYVKQKLFKLKEDVSVYEDEAQTRLAYTIKADRWLDWSAAYSFQDKNGNKLGKVGRKGGKSLFKAHYELYDENDKQDLIIREDSFMIRVLDALFSEIPILGMFTGYVFNPKYNITRPDGTLVAQIVKTPSLVGRRFQLNKLTEYEQGEELRIVLGMIMLVLLERRRG